MRRTRARAPPRTSDPPFDHRRCRCAATVARSALVVEGVRVETGGELDLLDRADELGRSSRRIENMQLLDDVTRSRRELENTFDSIAHLVVVSDQRGAIVHANQAFASRVGHKREELVDRPLAELHRPGAGGTGWPSRTRTSRAAASCRRRRSRFSTRF